MSTFSEYEIKVASKPLQKAALVSLFLFLVALYGRYMIPKSDFPFPDSIFQVAIILTQVFFVASVIATLAFVFYREQVKVTLNEQGIYFPKYNFISWERIQWYRIDLFSSKIGIKRVILNVDSSKAVILAEESEALFSLAEDIKQKLRLYNPLAKDYKELKSSKTKAYILIFIFIAIHLTIYVLTNYEKKYILIFTPVLLIIIWAILMEHINMPGDDYKV